MAKKSRFLLKHPELRILLLIIGYALLSWPIFNGTQVSVGAMVSSLFLFWGLAILMLFLISRSR